MGLLFADAASGGDFGTKVEAEWLREAGCKACPLNTTPGKIDATGAANPKIYMLGEAAGRDEEREREQFVGTAGQLLRKMLPKEVIRVARWNNVLNCHPPKNRDPSRQETECCRPRVETDIERTKPKAIWGFGNVPLNWVGGFSGITNWRGRRMPVKVGNHTCWYYAFLHPSYLNRIANDYNDEFGSEDERMTWLDLAIAFDDLDDLETPVVYTPAMAKANIECITDINHIRAALQWAAKLPTAGIDWETNRLRPYEEGAKLLTAAVGTMEKAYAFPLEHPGAGYSKKQLEEIKELLRRFLVSASCKKVAHNAAFELEWSGHRFGVETIRARPWVDTANAAAIIDERFSKVKDGPLSLNFQVQQYFGFNLKQVSNVDRARLEYTPLETVLQYNGIDAKFHDGVWHKQWPIIKREGLEEPYRLAYRRVPTVVLSQIKGVPVDQKCVKKLQKKYQTKVKEIKQNIADIQAVQKFVRQKGKAFNPLSPDDVAYVLDELLGCEEIFVVDKKTREKKISTEEPILQEIIINHADDDAAILAQSLIDLREVNGTKSKYIDALSEDSKNSVLFPDGLIHTNFNTYFTDTGRLSSDEPNLQNFPKRNKDTKETRRSIAARYGECVLAFDYGQIEARVIAMFTKDPVFVKALWDRFDVHQDWAERLAYEYPGRIGGKKFLKDKDVMKDFRTDIKNQWTFPLFFGASSKSVSENIKIPQDIIEAQVKKFWKVFPGTKKWQEDTIRDYQENGYVECLTGRRRRGPLRYNQIINTPIQGTAAEIVLDAMSRLSEIGNLELQPEINIHDDLTFLRVPMKSVDEITEKVVDIMLAVPFKWVNVPITVEASFGKNWCDLEEFGKFSSDEWKKEIAA